MKPSGVMTLLTDFGITDGYVAAMKGVILSRTSGVTIVDISHDIERHDIVGGAFVLASVVPYFPRGTVHVGVVDPGVGSKRAAVAVRTDDGWFVGPDNGLFWRAAGASVLEVRRIESIPGWERERSSTFHGRDLFAPAGAHIAMTGDMEPLGLSLPQISLLTTPQLVKGVTSLEGVVIHIDGFGNIISNIHRDDLRGLPATFKIIVAGIEIGGLVNCYADVERGTLCALIGSDGYLEIAVAEGSAAQRLAVERGAVVSCHGV